MSSLSTSKNRILYLDVLRVLAILSITANHAINRAFHNYSFQELDYAVMSLPETTLKAYITVFSRIGVFLFLMISGKLILNKDFEKEGALQRFLKHNYLGLFIATELWLFIMFWELTFLNGDLATNGVGQTLLNLLQNQLFVNQTTMNTMWYMNMLLLVYLLLPIYAVALKKFDAKVFVLPLLIVFIAAYIVPNFNNVLSLLGSKRDLNFALHAGYIFSKYTVYVFLGYFLDKGLLKKVPSWVVSVVFFAASAAMVALQVYGYSIPRDFIFDNNSVLFVIISVCIFEWYRRYGDHYEKARGPITWFSRITFGIYLLHLCIMEWMYYYTQQYDTLNPWLEFLLLWAGSVAASTLLIAALAKVPFFKKYLFLIK